MARDSMIKAVNTKLKAVLDEAKAHKDGPRLVAAIEAIVRLTNSDADNAAMDEAEAKIAEAAPKCQHENLDRTGKCKSCGDQVLGE